MYKDGKIQLLNWLKGMAVSPYFGFGKMINCDIYSQPGVLKCSNALALNNSITISGTPTASYIYGGNLFVGTSTGNVYKNGSIIASGLSAIHDLTVYKDYLLITETSPFLNTYGPLSTAPAYNSHILSLDNIVYGYRKMVLNTTDPTTGVWIGNENYIASLSSSFNGTADASFSAHRFQLPVGRVETTLCEFGDDLAIMTKFQNGTDFASIIFWDKAATYGSVVHLSETVCNQMIASNNRLYYIGNDTGTFYESNKSSFTKIWSIQDRRSWQTFSNYQNAICIAQNQILFGFAPGITTNPDPVFYAVYAYQVGAGVSIRNTISTGNYGLSQGLSITSLVAQNQGVYYATWLDGSTVGLNSVNIAAYAVAQVESELMQVGTFFNTKTLAKLEANLGENLPAGSSILVEYRKTLSDAFTNTRTISPESSGGIGRYENSFASEDLTTVQIRVTLNPGTSALTTPALAGVYIS